MSETLEERIRRTAKEDYALGMVNHFASDLVELLDARDDRIHELEAALAGKHEAVCAYCHELLPREDPKAILEHITTCDQRPEKMIFEAWERENKEFRRRIAMLVDAAVEVLEKYQQEGEFEAVKALNELIKKGPGEDEPLEEPQEAQD